MIRTALITTAGLLALAATANAQQGVVHNADWLKKPTAQDLVAVFPTAALKKGLGGQALIECKVTVEGAVHDCSVVSETPSGFGFGLAAIALTPQFQFTPETIGGKPVESTIRIPIDFPAEALPSTEPGSRLPNLSRQNNVNLTQVLWTTAPSVSQVAAAYPDAAAHQKLGGLVTLNCSFGREGRLSGCDVAAESPKGLGFGRAALSLSDDFVGPVSDSSGASTAGDSTQLVVAFAPEMLNASQPVIGEPRWTKVPEALDMAAAFPAAATAAHVSVGHVVLSCDVGASGMLNRCAVEQQSPDGLGFGAAAMALSGHFQVSVWTDEGLPTVGGRINVPIRYEAAAPQAQAATATP